MVEWALNGGLYNLEDWGVCCSCVWTWGVMYFSREDNIVLVLIISSGYLHHSTKGSLGIQLLMEDRNYCYVLLDQWHDKGKRYCAPKF